ncbi:MAG: UbiD family decarboxylase, partial [Thermoplasmata archaeon]
MPLKKFIEKYDHMTVEGEVSIDCEVTEHAKKNPETPIYFPDFPHGPSVINLWASRSRLADHFGIEKGEMIERLADAVDSPSAPEQVERAGFEDKTEEEFDLRELPIPKYYPNDGGRYITSGIVITEYEGKRNLSYHRMMLRDEKTFTIRICPRHLKKMYEKAKERNEELDIAVVIGVEPSVLLAAATSIDYEVDETGVANSLKKTTLSGTLKIKELENGISVPSDAEYVLQGRITHDLDKEGPFVDITGTYDKVRQQPIVEIDRVYRKEDAEFHALLPGGYEHFLLMGLPRESEMKRKLNKITSVEDVRLTEGGCSWLHGVVSINDHEANVKKIIEEAFEVHTSMKKITVVDDDIDIFDDREVEWAVATRFQPDEDIYIYEDQKGSS